MYGYKKELKHENQIIEDILTYLTCTLTNFFQLYEGVEKKSLYQTISAHKPSSLIALEFDNQETLLIFLEDKKLMKIYEYRGKLC